MGVYVCSCTCGVCLLHLHLNHKSESNRTEIDPGKYDSEQNVFASWSVLSHFLELSVRSHELRQRLEFFSAVTFIRRHQKLKVTVKKEQSFLSFFKQGNTLALLWINNVWGRQNNTKRTLSSLLALKPTLWYTELHRVMRKGLMKV